MNNEIIVISGFAGAGKDTLAKAVHELHGHEFVISHSTRPMRPNESQGNPYYFISDNEMCTMSFNNELIEGRCYNTTKGSWFYAVHKDQIKPDKRYVVVLDVLGYREFVKHFGDRVFGIFIDVPEPERFIRVQRQRPMEVDEWNRRLLDDESQFPKSVINSEYQFVINNDDYNITVNEISSIITDFQSQRCKLC
jgi:guanylate kinase